MKLDFGEQVLIVMILWLILQELGLWIAHRIITRKKK